MNQAITEMRSGHNSAPASVSDIPEHRLVEEHWIRCVFGCQVSREYFQKCFTFTDLNEFVCCSYLCSYLFISFVSNDMNRLNYSDLFGQFISVIQDVYNGDSGLIEWSSLVAIHPSTSHLRVRM